MLDPLNKIMSIPRTIFHKTMSNPKPCTLRDIEKAAKQADSDVYDNISDPDQYVFESLPGPSNSTVSLLLAKDVDQTETHFRVQGAYLDGHRVFFVIGSEGLVLRAGDALELDDLSLEGLRMPFAHLARSSSRLMPNALSALGAFVRFVYMLTNGVEQQPWDMAIRMADVCKKIRYGYEAERARKRSADKMTDKEDQAKTKFACIREIEESVQILEDISKKELSAAAHRENTLRNDTAALRANLDKEKSTTARLQRELADAKAETSRLQRELAIEKTNIARLQGEASMPRLVIRSSSQA
ncbi:hypothetical protein C7974DRAFT_417999 [Boeremia exigua]|uniref:uncharacterized protein n=1 Tax=Boeremia exigua TaxID=749465 RepID=UPI001E8ECF85|nr:uncharacterized protein C7974DRAFT_417999 [Boeremia exigua]KAH6614281.1 hypothetical protein C7974DRAFT_417999 [Boeremia exigua]